MKFLLAGMAFGVLLLTGQQNNNQQHVNQSKNAQAHQARTESRSVSQSSAAPTSTQQDTDHGRRSDNQDQTQKVSVISVPEVGTEKKVIDRLTLLFTFILAVTAVFGTCYALQTLKAIQHEAKIATAALKESGKLAKAAKASVDVLTVAANAARESAEFARLATKNSERADILIENASIFPVNANGSITGDSSLHITFKNFGRTRGRDVSLMVKMLIPGIELKNGTSELPLTVMGPGQDQMVTFQPFRGFLTQQTFMQIIEGKIELHFQASAVYSDVFGSTYTTMDVGVLDPKVARFRVLQKIAG
jgi:hypothetical protein